MRRGFTLNLSRMKAATMATATEAAREIETSGRADIKSAGQFGSRWTEGFTASAKSSTGGLFGATITVRHSVRYWRIFEEGGLIRGAPMLWIPLSHTNIKVPASIYAKSVGLFTVKRPGKPPLLFSKKTRKPVYVGVSSVRQRKRFHLRAICNQVRAKLPEMYRKNYNGK
jgi:hypothetical protein